MEIVLQIDSYEMQSHFIVRNVIQVQYIMIITDDFFALVFRNNHYNFYVRIF